jgi:hypothetical protein
MGVRTVGTTALVDVPTSHRLKMWASGQPDLRQIILPCARHGPAFQLILDVGLTRCSTHKTVLAPVETPG